MERRSRDLLPLPLPFPNTGFLETKCSHARYHRSVFGKSGLRRWCNDGVRVLDQLYGGSPPSGAPTQLQHEVIRDLVDSYEAMGEPPIDMSPAGSFKDLCGSAVPYTGGASGAPVPFIQGATSLPSAGFTPVPLDEVLPPAHRVWMENGSERMLRDSSETNALLEHLQLHKPYHDPTFHSPKTYGAFLVDLASRGLLEWHPAGEAYLGVFFVPKKDGRQRMILDTRVVNAHFIDPPKTRLPTAAALTGFESVAGQELYIAGGDIDNCFYRFEVPQHLRHKFSLPRIRARFLSSEIRKEHRLRSDDLITPCLRVLPMGWSWSLFLAQMSHEEVGRSVGQSDKDLIQDRSAVEPLGPHGIKHAKYVDNFLIVGHDPQEVGLQASSLQSALDNKGLLCHEIFGPSLSATFAGLDIDGVSHRTRISRKRLWRIRFAIDHILRASSVSGAALEAVIGHVTWAMLVRREALSILDSVYRFIKNHYSVPAPWAPMSLRNSGA